MIYVRKMFLLLAVTAVLFSLLVLPASAAFKPEYRMHVNVAETTSWGHMCSIFAQKVKEYTGGKVNIKVYWSAQLIAGKQASEAMFIRNGTIDFSCTVNASMASVIPQFDIFNLPFFVSSYPDKYKALDAMMNGRAGKMLNEICLEKGGFRVLNWSDNGFKQYHYTGKIPPILAPEDMKGVRIRYVSAPLYRDNLLALGANPMAMNWEEALQGFQQGLVDAGENSVSIMYGYRIWEFNSQVTDLNSCAAAQLLIANEKIWQSFDEETQKQVQAAADFAGKWRTATQRIGLGDNGESEKTLREMGMWPPDPKLVPLDPYQDMRDHGMTIHILTAEQIKKFKDQMAHVYEKWIPIIGEELYEAAIQDMEESQK